MTSPWNLVYELDEIFVYEGDACVCEIAQSHDFINPHPEVSKNARLVAAAPELLEALEEILTHAPRINIGKFGHACHMAESAIFKAKGK